MHDILAVTRSNGIRLAYRRRFMVLVSKVDGKDFASDGSRQARMLRRTW